MHYICLDTNTWIYLANGTEPVRLLDYIDKEVEKNNIVILLPETIISEWEDHKDKTVMKGSMKHFKDINTALNRILKLLGDKGEKDILNFLFDNKDDTDYFKDFIISFNKKKEEVQNAVSHNIKLIDNLFKTKSTLIPIEDKVYKKAGQFALAKKAPFKGKNSFADALILFSLLDYVKEKSIEESIFISYNTDDFCEKKEGKKILHPDLKDEFSESKCRYFKIVGEALNTIEKDIVTKEELVIIEELQNDFSHNDDLEFCEICQENNNRISALYFSEVELADERTEVIIDDPNQAEFDFAKSLPKTKGIGRQASINVGSCNWCSSEHFKCVDCGYSNAVWEGEFNKPKECESCGLEYLVSKKYDRNGIESVEYSIHKNTETCEKCGQEFNKDDMIENLCFDCENEYSYGE